ncbi:hypothetical protein MUK42_37021, partial [Musa troglodytarum]
LSPHHKGGEARHLPPPPLPPLLLLSSPSRPVHFYLLLSPSCNSRSYQFLWGRRVDLLDLWLLKWRYGGRSGSGVATSAHPSPPRCSTQSTVPWTSTTPAERPSLPSPPRGSPPWWSARRRGADPVASCPFLPRAPPIIPATVASPPPPSPSRCQATEPDSGLSVARRRRLAAPPSPALLLVLPRRRRWRSSNGSPRRRSYMTARGRSRARSGASSGGRLAALLNSLFAAAAKRPKKSKTPTATAAGAVGGYDDSACSTLSSHSRSCLVKAPSSRQAPPAEDEGAKRSVRFHPVSVIVGEDLRPCGQKSVYSGDRAAEVEGKGKTETRMRVEELLRRFEDGEEEDGEISDSSSDLFELENLTVMTRGEGYRDELPVYETTHAATYRAISRGLIP